MLGSIRFQIQIELIYKFLSIMRPITFCVRPITPIIFEKEIFSLF